MILGIDPGLCGALVLLHQSRRIDIFDIPTLKAKSRGREVNWSEVARWIDTIGAAHIDHAVIETASARPGQGVSSMFKFGYVCGGLRGMVAAYSIPVTMVSPQRWKREMGVPAAKDGARARATELLPESSEFFRRVKDHGRAEAALIALWGQRSLGDPTAQPGGLFREAV